jgi:hypothetical protein
MSNNISATENGPLAASPRASAVGQAAAVFVVSLHVLLDELKSEGAAVRALGLDESDARVLALSRDFAFTEEVIDTTSKAVAKSWTRLHSRSAA